MEDLYFNPLTKGNKRNDPCFCNSGKKTKRCHGEKTFLSKEEIEEFKETISKNLKSKNIQEAE